MFLAIGWVGFDSIVLHPTFHSCKHLFQAFPTLNQAFTFKHSHSIHLTNAQLNLRHDFTIHYATPILTNNQLYTIIFYDAQKLNTITCYHILKLTMHEDYASTNSEMHATKLAQSSNINSNTTIYANTLHTCIKTQSYLKNEN